MNPKALLAVALVSLTAFAQTRDTPPADPCAAAAPTTRGCPVIQPFTCAPHETLVCGGGGLVINSSSCRCETYPGVSGRCVTSVSWVRRDPTRVSVSSVGEYCDDADVDLALSVALANRLGLTGYR